MRSTLITILILSVAAIGPSRAALMPDSFGFLPGSSLMEPGNLAIEAHVNRISDRGLSLVGYPNALIRYGVNARSEFQLSLPSVYRFSSKYFDETSFSNGTLGFKGRVAGQLSTMVTAGIPIFENEVASDNMWVEMDLFFDLIPDDRVDVVPTAGLYLHDVAGMFETYGVLVRAALLPRLWVTGDFSGITDEGHDDQSRVSGQVCCGIGTQWTLGVGVRKVLDSGVEEQYLLGVAYEFRQPLHDVADAGSKRPSLPRRQGI